MKQLQKILFYILFTFTIACKKKEEPYLVKEVDTVTEKIQMHWKDKEDNNIYTFQNLKTQLDEQNQNLIFAMNGGMYTENYAPKGLYIDKGKILNPLDTGSGKGNFYLQPNGVFYITSTGVSGISLTKDFNNINSIEYATQSGPILLWNNEINHQFSPNSKNLNIRNGVGISDEGKTYFVMSKKEVSFYQLAEYFRQLGCTKALYLDGYVSRCYDPSQQWIQNDGQFGVIISVIKK